MTGHLCADINQGALLAALPFLVVYSGFSYTDVSLLVFASNIVSAIVQPLFGYWGDKVSRPWFMAAGIALAGLGMCGIGLFQDYALIMVSAMVSGLGVALFHPEGGRLANLVAGEQKNSGMSIFAVGGKLGFCVGPLMAAASLSAWGMAGTVVFLVPSLGCALVFLSKNRRFRAFDQESERNAASIVMVDHWGAFSLVMGALSARSILYYALTAFIPLFLIAELGQNEGVSSTMITVFALAGAFATLMSGYTARRVQVKRLMIGAYALTAVLIALFAVCRILPLSIVLIIALALVVDISYPSSVALGQSFVPNHLGMASGLSFGVVVCVGGIASPFLGMAGDAVGLTPVMLVLVGVALVASLISCFVPSSVKRRA